MTTRTVMPVVHVQTGGDIDEADVAYVRDKVGAAMRFAREPVLFVRAKLTMRSDPAVARPAIVQVNVDLNGRPVRAQAARPTLREAADEVHDRLQNQLTRAARRDWEKFGADLPSAQPGERRRGSAEAANGAFTVRPAEERQVVRHKSFATGRMTVDEAAFDMDMLGYEFYLFAEDSTGSDSVLARTPDGGYELHQLDPQPERVTVGVTEMSVAELHPPSLRVGQAVEQLDVTGWPFVFFGDEDSGRGCVLYRRYDGNYVLMTPSD